MVLTCVTSIEHHSGSSGSAALKKMKWKVKADTSRKVEEIEVEIVTSSKWFANETNDDLIPTYGLGAIVLLTV